MSTPENGVYDINIIYNDKAYYQDALFAYQVVDKLHEQGIKPALDNVMLGKDLNGNFLTWNFKDPNNSAVAIYGAKGSGKGVMTLNLISSALADGCYLMYMDAKPDTAKALVDVAWSNGKEVFAFNGKEVRDANLERNPNAPSSRSNRFMSKELIKERLGSKLYNSLFITEADAEEFILLTTYYRGVEAVIKIAEDRAAQNINGSTPDNWVVAIFDEVQQLAECETKIMERLKTAKDARKKAKEERVGKNGDTKAVPINYLKDPVYQFIEEYEMWRAMLESKIATALGSTFRKANITVFYIWQTTSFPNKFSATSLIASAIKQEGGSIVKLVGRAALESGGSTVFGTPTSVKEAGWYDEKFTGTTGGYWAIGNNVTRKMKVYRPFNVYSDANSKGLLITNAKAAGLNEEDLYGISLDYSGNVIPEIGFKGYVDKLLRPYGLDAATQLNRGYTYADNFIRSSGLGESLLNFMYNAHSFIVQGESGAADNVTDEQSGFRIDDENDGAEPSIPQNNQQNAQQMAQQNGEPGFNMDDMFSGADVFADKNGNQQPQNFQQQQTFQQQQAEAGSAYENSGRFFGGYGGTFTETTYNNTKENNVQPENDIFEKNKPTGPVLGDSPITKDVRYGQIYQSFLSRYQEDEDTSNGYFQTVRYNPRSAYQISNGVTFMTPDTTVRRYGLNESNSIIISVAETRRINGFFNRVKYRILGQQRELDDRWGIILKGIVDKLKSRGSNAFAIADVYIMNDMLVFGKMQIAAFGLLGGLDGVEVRHIVNFKLLNNRFRNIRSLHLDNDTAAALLAEANYENPVDYLFKNFNKLESIYLHYPDGKGAKFTRAGYLNDKKQRQATAKMITDGKVTAGIDNIVYQSVPSIRYGDKMRAAIARKMASFVEKIKPVS